MTKVMITGGCGFIGRNLVEYLEKQGGYDITIIDDLSMGTQFQTKAAVSVEDIYTVSKLDVDVVVNCAAQCGVQQSIRQPMDDVETNVGGLVNLLEKARDGKVQRFIQISSFAALNPVTPYGLGKWVGERYCQLFSELYGLETVVLRLSNVYGRYSDHKTSVVAKWIRQRKQGESLTVYGDGNQVRDFICVDDVVRAIAQAMMVCLPEKHMVLPVCTGVATRVKDVAGLISDRIKFVPRPDGDVSGCAIDPLVGNVLLNVCAATSVKDGIRGLVKEYVMS